MANNLDRVTFWRDFICSRCQFPDPETLRLQFQNAEFSEFCRCGCNSFKVEVHAALALPIASKSGLIFEADFYFAKRKDRTLEILLFADTAGNLSYVEVACCVNSFPVRDVIEVDEPPFRVFTSQRLLRHQSS